MRSRVVATAAVIAMLFAVALMATSYVSASGTVHGKTATTLKIVRSDGSKVNANCLLSDAIRYECQIATPGDPADGAAVCEDGWCSWIALDVRPIGG